MTFSKIGRILTALVATAALGLGMTACGGGTIGYLFITGSYYNQVTGFKIDDYTGNLTGIDHSPFASGGNNPVTVLVKPGGRYLYVINAGTPPTAASLPGTTNFKPTGDAGITVYSIGGDGVLTYQETYQSKGFQPIWATFDGTGNYLYILDKYSEYYCAAAPCKTPNPSIATANPVDLNSSITAFSVAGDTGRLTFIPNAAVLSITPPQVGIDVFEVGQNPIMTKVGSGNCLFTMSPTAIFPYVIGTGGQLTVTTTGTYAVSGATNLTSINTSGTTSAAAYIYLTDAGTNQIFTVTASGTPCSLAPVAGSYQANVSGANNPVNSLTSSNGKFLYVINQSNTGSPTNTAQSSISAYTIDGTGRLSVLADSTNNPYAVGSGPVCIVQDPTGQYIYTANGNDNTITGKLFNQQYGTLSDLSRGSVFLTTMHPTCLAVDGNT